MRDGGQLKDSSHLIKHIFGEAVRATSPDRMISEVKRAFILCNILINI